MAGVVGLAATLTPALSLKGEGEVRRLWLGAGPAGVVFVGLGCAEDPSPNLAEDGRVCLSPWRG